MPRKPANSRRSAPLDDDPRVSRVLACWAVRAQAFATMDRFVAGQKFSSVEEMNAAITCGGGAGNAAPASCNHLCWSTCSWVQPEGSYAWRTGWPYRLTPRSAPCSAHGGSMPCFEAPCVQAHQRLALKSAPGWKQLNQPIRSLRRSARRA